MLYWHAQESTLASLLLDEILSCPQNHHPPAAKAGQGGVRVGVCHRHQRPCHGGWGPAAARASALPPCALCTLRCAAHLAHGSWGRWAAHRHEVPPQAKHTRMPHPCLPTPCCSPPLPPYSRCASSCSRSIRRALRARMTTRRGRRARGGPRLRVRACVPGGCAPSYIPSV